MVREQMRVNSLRVRAAGLDPLTVQLRAARALNSLEPQLMDPGPAAIVCIRRLRDPRPGSLRLEAGGLPLAHAWVEAVHKAIAGLARHAARPALGPVPATAEAVLFNDRAELLACLAADWVAGWATSRWWWHVLFPGINFSKTLSPLLIGEPAYLPATLQLLSENGLVGALVQSLSVEEARTVLRSLVRTFSLPPACLPFDLPSNDDLAEGQTIPETEHPVPVDATDSLTAEAAPWRDCVPEANWIGLEPEHRAVIGVSLLLHRSSALARTPAFADSIARWWRATKDGPLNGIPTPVADAFSSSGAYTKAPSEEPIAWSQSMAIPISGESQSRGAECTDLLIREQRPHTSIKSQLPFNDGALPVASLHSGHAQPARFEPQIAALRESLSSARVLQGTQALETEWGGLFYFINLGQFLGLYGDFTTPGAPGITLSTWDFVALLGEQLLGAPIEADPVWNLLARLAGRNAGQPPGYDFEPPDDWRMPVDWLKSFHQPPHWSWSLENARLQVRHPENFIVLDIAVSAAEDLRDPPRQLMEEMSVYGDGAESRLQHDSRFEATRGRSRLECWLGLLIPYVRSRLRQALGLVDGINPGELLCRHAARVYVTATHLDILFSLAELPIELRLSGLDRDPGWVPAAGRFVRFHYH
jgi:hypothetical protein